MKIPNFSTQLLMGDGIGILFLGSPTTTLELLTLKAFGTLLHPFFKISMGPLKISASRSTSPFSLVLSTSRIFHLSIPPFLLRKLEGWFLTWLLKKPRDRMASRSSVFKNIRILLKMMSSTFVTTSIGVEPT